MWEANGESVMKERLPQFRTFQFRPWPMNGLTEAMEEQAKSEIEEKAKVYRKQMEQREAMKHIDEIRKKLAWIDAFRERRKKILETVEKERKEEKEEEEEEEEMVEM